ncbi:hypothetical protein Tco_0857992 [Tanacetum coccineum]|uniref:Uncharacterized protein n=1 Tax=Tanacetum coccineum TaxID=301880 RepID=A0ABQ5B7S9_9ASTR
MEAQDGKFLDMIRVVRINVPLVDVLAGMPNYGKFLKELIRNKHKIKQIYAAFLSDESSAMIQNKVPPKLRDPGTSDEELEEPMEDQPLPADASPTALSPGYIADSDPEEDEEDPEEDLADHHVDKGDNDDNESSDDDDDDDDV